MVQESFGTPLFVHGEDEDDINNLVEKLRFKEDQVQEFEEFYEGENLTCTEEEKQEFLFESIFRKANRNYSFMVKVVDTYSTKFKEWFSDKAKFVERLYTMWEKTPVKLYNFMEIFMRGDYGIIQPQDVYAFVMKVEELKEGHFRLVKEVLKYCYFVKDAENQIKAYECLSSMLLKYKETPSFDAVAETVSIIRRHLQVSKGANQKVFKIFESHEKIYSLFTKI